MNDKALKPGTILIGNKTYVIEKVLGSGGFGITYLASYTIKDGNISIRASVAIKEHFLRAHCNRDVDGSTVVCPGTEDSQALTANSLRDFVAEAKRLSDYGAGHPNIVKVNEIIEANGTAYYVMEYLEGQSVADYLDEHGTLSEKEIEEIVYPIIDATAYLHRRMVTHLDIKPGNIMLSKNSDGTVRPVLIDFGLSKHYNADGSATSTVNTMACSDGFSPMEQYTGIRTFSPAADVYALGATLYNAITGKRPIISSDWPSGEPAATISTLPVSEKLRRVITRAMSDRAAERFKNAGAMLADLGVSSAATTGTSAITVTNRKDTNKTKELPESKSVKSAPVESAPIKSSKSFTRIGLIAFCALVFLLAAWGGYKLFSGGNQESDSQDLIAEVIDTDSIPENTEQQITEQVIEQEEIQTVEQPQQQTDNSAEEAEQLAAERAEIERQRQELERLNAERAEADRQREEAAERERLRQQAAERERQQQEAAARQNREEINGLTVNWGSGVTAAQKEVLRRLVNNMVYVAGGIFRMGAPNRDREAWNREKPQHQVTLSSYRIGKYEVTQKEWETVMGSNPSHFRGDNNPVEQVSWNDCQNFISRLNQMTGLRFRLPTEAQWEFAARGGNRSNGYKYSGSNNLGSVAWYIDNSGSRTHPVGQKASNELGLFDMTGNVWEWCYDWYDSYRGSSQTNPTGPSSGSNRVYRGGSWNFIARYCRVSNRINISPGSQFDNLGLRLSL